MQNEAAPQTAVDRLRRDIVKDRERIQTAMQINDSGDQPQGSRVGRLYQVFEAVGQAQ